MQIEPYDINIYTTMTFFIVQYVLDGDSEPSGIIMFDNIMDRLHRIIDILELDHSMTTICHDGAQLDPNMSIRDSTLQTKDIVYITDGYRDLDHRLNMLIELRKQSDIYREAKLYTLLLVANCDAVFNHTPLDLNVIAIGSHNTSIAPIRLKNGIRITPQHRNLIRQIYNDAIMPMDHHDSPLVTYRKELVRFLESCTESYVQLRLDRLTTEFGLSTPILKSDSLRTLKIEAKYKLSLAYTNSSIMDDETNYNMDMYSHIGYLRTLQQLIKIVHKNRIDGLKPTIGVTYHDITYDPYDLSEFIEDDPYYLTCLL